MQQGKQRDYRCLAQRQSTRLTSEVSGFQNSQCLHDTRIIGKSSQTNQSSSTAEQSFHTGEADGSNPSFGTKYTDEALAYEIRRWDASGILFC